MEGKNTWHRYHRHKTTAVTRGNRTATVHCATSELLSFQLYEIVIVSPDYAQCKFDKKAPAVRKSIDSLLDARNQGQ